MVTLRAMGERAILAEVADLSSVLSLHAALAADPPPGIDELVPAARTVLVAFDPSRLSAPAVRAWIRAAGSATAPAAAPGPLVEIPARYDGADLTDTAQLLGLTVAQLVARHAAAEWTVAFTGFAPGFAYLVSPDWRFDVPRLAAPRTRVPAGAVGVAGEFTGAYPRETPGGWRLLATTDVRLFDPDAARPVLLPPRARVRFVPSRALAAAASPPPVSRVASGAREERVDAVPPASLRILAPGASATIQDLGRPHRAALGVARSGALDRGALRVANRLVGNAESAAGVEVVLGGLRVRAERDTWVAVTGALADLRIDGVPVPAYAPVRLAAGAELDIGVARAGVRLYLGARGGVLSSRVLGSKASDSLAGLGRAPLAAGDVLSLGRPAGAVPVVDAFPWTVPPARVDVPVGEGPRADWFAPSAWSTLTRASWTVSSRADRVGIRLDGPVLDRLRHHELPSEAMRPGAIQVPPHGRPVVLLADGPVTGGYPVIGVVPDAALDALAQVRPGDHVRFRGR